MGMTGIAKMVWGWPWVGQRDGMGIQQDWRLATHKTSAAQLIWIPVSTRIQGLYEWCSRADLGRKISWIFCPDRPGNSSKSGCPSASLTLNLLDAN
jgi:hypothetical protein